MVGNFHKRTTAWTTPTPSPPLMMSVKRLYVKLLGRGDVRPRVTLVLSLTALCVFLLTFRSITESPVSIRDFDADGPEDLPLNSRQWSVRKPLVERDYSNKIIVVEEHHEVLQYWLQDSSLPKKGNVLVHIDGHEDGSMPTYKPNFPWFTRPSNTQELRVLMQENDMFIMGAIMSGLISRMVFIWPSWDEKNRTDHYESTEVGIGWYVPDPKVVDKPKELCTCEIDDGDSSELAYECLSAATDESDTNSTEPQEMPVNASECTIVTRFRMETVRDTSALKRLVRGGWILPRESVILDIDEDFFGCEAAATRFSKVGVGWETIEELDELVDRLFCVRTVEIERVTDQFLADVITTVLDRSTSDRQGTVNAAMKKFHDLSKTGHKMVCRMTPGRERHNSESVNELMKSIIEMLMGFTQDQLKLLLKIGFCLSYSPVTYIDESPTSMPHFQVCHGSTEPDNTLITHHVPTPPEIDQQTLKLQKILNALPPPKRITVCRSFRDGYTPKEHFPQIEKNILTSLKESYPSYDTVHYDPLLLGGPEGWFARKYSNYR